MAFVIKHDKLYYMTGRQWSFNKSRATQYVERKLAEKAIRKMAPGGNYEIVPAETVTEKRPLFKSSSADKYSKLSENTKDVLAYLIHSKDHVLLQGHKDSAIEEALKKYSTVSSKTLYRGCSEVEFNNVAQGKPSQYYMSFSEDQSVAKSFGPKLIILHKAKGFNYAEYLVEAMNELRENNPNEYDSADGDFMIETAEEEKEWILPFGLVLKAISNGFVMDTK